VLLALTRAVPPSIVRCELTHRARVPIDPARAAAQHRRSEETLATLGCTVQRLPGTPDLPDSVFVEDTAVVLPEIAVLARPGARARRPEVPSVEEALRRYRPLARIEPPGTLDGGDVLRLGSTLFVGRSGRTDAEGIRQLQARVAPFGYTVEAVEMRGCLHLKTAATAVADGVVLVNPAWLPGRGFRGVERIEVHPDEPLAANALRVGDGVIHPAACRRTRERLEARGIAVHPVDADELEKAEAGVTCCSIVFTA
jgi:dimethylargininase